MAAEGCVPRMNVHGSGSVLLLLLTVDCFRLLGLSPCGHTSESGNKGGKAENLHGQWCLLVSTMNQAEC